MDPDEILELDDYNLGLGTNILEALIREAQSNGYDRVPDLVALRPARGRVPRADPQEVA